MATTNNPIRTLDAEHIDDILYLVRVNEKVELQQDLKQLSQHYDCSPDDIILQCIDPNNGNSTLHFSAANGLHDLISFILQTTSSININSSMPLSFVNLRNTEGNTALHWASLNGHVEAVKLLVAAGADMWLKNSAGHLALFEAERAEKSEVVQYLLQAGGKEVERTGTEAEEDGDIVQASSAAENDV